MKQKLAYDKINNVVVRVPREWTNVTKKTSINE